MELNVLLLLLSLLLLLLLLGQIRQRIRNERIEEKVLAGVGLKHDEIDDVFDGLD